MRYPKYLINGFAILGVASFIFLTSSAAVNIMDNEGPIKNNGDNNPLIQNNYGLYQMSVIPSLDGNNPNGENHTIILNTETGEVRCWKWNGYSYKFLRVKDLTRNF